MVLVLFLLTVYQNFSDEDYPGGQGVIYDGYYGKIVKESPDLDEDWKYSTTYYSGSFCPTITGNYSLTYTLSYSIRFASIPSIKFCMVVDNSPQKCLSKTGESSLTQQYYLYRGKCYAYSTERYGGDASGVINTFYLTINGTREQPITSFAQNPGEACMIPKEGPKRLGFYCQDYTTIYCNNHGNETFGIKVTPGDEVCECNNTDSDIFCEPYSYLPFGSNSGKLIPKLYDTWSDQKLLRSGSAISLESQNTTILKIPDEDIYKKIVYTGFIYLPQKGDYSFRVTSRLMANLQIGNYNGNLDSTDFTECGKDKTKHVLELKVTTDQSKTIQPFHLSVFTQCSFIDDRDIQLEWKNEREAYLKKEKAVYTQFPVKYLTDNSTAFIEP